MSALFSAADLRTLADALDSLTETSARTGVIVRDYSDGHITMNDHVIRLRWEDSEEPGTLAQPTSGRYVIEFPDHQ
ncbi:hypothetical protein [Streptomyces scabiei]|uniref:hypothetical protein n=1 Tax=Streptomyces scabiei TaxID=1930 RepID=UPI000E68B85D|nr:hypothetical protein [Streptomyces scabiei]MDX3026727.1 hypothetical protein [Streptomyces scabiei]MDX3208071.1 hypothetical protein [Streptomyces scabiei]